MIKRLSSLVLICVLIISLVGCQSKKVEDTKVEQPKQELTSIEKIKQSGKIILGTSADFPPYESHEIKDGKDTIVGFDIDISQAIAKKIGVQLEIKDTKFDGLVPSLIAGNINFVAAGMTPTPDRMKSVDFSQIYYNAEQVLVIKEGDTIKTAEDMKGKKIGAQLGTTSEKAAMAIEGIQIKQMDKVDQLMMEVKSSRLNGIVVEDTVAGAYVKQIGGLTIVKMSELNSEPGGSAIAVQKGDKELQTIVDEVINELKSSGEYDKLIQKWF